MRQTKKVAGAFMLALVVSQGCARAVTRDVQALAPMSASPTPEDIRLAANAAETFLTGTVSAAQSRANSLKRSIVVGEIVSKVGQYVGGAGAIIFGLDEKGRNAAYAASVAAAATVADQLLKNNEKSEHRATCLELASMRVELDKVIGAWRLQAADPTFQAGFIKERSDFYDRVDERFKKCNNK